ncbi:hypothetical protein BGZ54_002661 [Gamsiella multidivaricata]|nr:hypothetical protein BGZ54_002661 [Gamsiella multidivaricata]
MSYPNTSPVLHFRLIVYYRLTVRNPNAGKAVLGAFASLAGGESSTYIEMAEKARERAFLRMLEHAAAAGGNAVIGVQFTGQEIIQATYAAAAPAPFSPVQPGTPYSQPGTPYSQQPTSPYSQPMAHQQYFAAPPAAQPSPQQQQQYATPAPPPKN